jgi:hypothetical protein
MLWKPTYLTCLKQRGFIGEPDPKLDALGENTKFFHRMASKSYRNNFISYLKTEDERILCDPNEKASAVWYAFKDIVGKSYCPIMKFI